MYLLVHMLYFDGKLKTFFKYIRMSNKCHRYGYRLNCVPLTNSHIEVLPAPPPPPPPVPQNRTAFGDRIFKEVIKLKWGHHSGPSSPMTRYPPRTQTTQRDNHVRTQ